MRKVWLMTLIYLISPGLYAAVTCKGVNYGVASIYTFTKVPNSNNLQLTINNKIQNMEPYQVKGIAVHTSTSALELLGQMSVQESYYYFVHGTNSFSEMISLSADMKQMGSSRPDPISESGNFIKLSCTGKL